ncbi:MAG: hypothetical protein GC165_09720 [Armatimonadetes bacterium]|nr:hypothetical protein [Armatimonadota bacterium]MBS1728590.1 hypothetical protein [Armatimonadota bacterium]
MGTSSESHLKGKTLRELQEATGFRSANALVSALADLEIITNSEKGNIRNALYLHRDDLGGLPQGPSTAILNLLTAKVGVNEFSQSLRSSTHLLCYVPSRAEAFLEYIYSMETMPKHIELDFIVARSSPANLTVQQLFSSWSYRLGYVDVIYASDYVVLSAGHKVESAFTIFGQEGKLSLRRWSSLRLAEWLSDVHPSIEIFQEWDTKDDDNVIGLTFDKSS